jgi:hypothetical protein
MSMCVKRYLEKMNIFLSRKDFNINFYLKIELSKEFILYE